MRLVIICALALSSLFAQDFPKDFKWCVATAAHQIEGNNFHSDWWLWEQDGKTADPSGVAVDHWNRLEEDTGLIKDIGANTYRMSVSWSKIEPRKGEFSQEALDHYKREIDLLIKNGITPMITLFHFVSPAWFAAEGGWANPKSVDYFVRFSNKVYDAIGEKVTFWTVHNEPMVAVAAGYASNVFPPAVSDTNVAFEAAKHMLISHGKIYRLFHKRAGKRKIMIGMAHHLRIFDANSWWNPLDHLMAFTLDNASNWAFRNALITGELKLFIPTLVNRKEKLPGVAGTQDFFGFNYYSRDLVKFNLFHPDKHERLTPKGATLTDIDWEIYPDGLRRVFKKVKKRFPGLPIYITENGIADDDDSHRKKYLYDHLKVIRDEIKSGTDVRGYCHWSLLDNFEWNGGFHPRFGLYYVDFETLERTPTESALYFKELATKNSLIKP